MNTRIMSTRRQRVRSALAATALASALAVSPAFVPSDAPLPNALKATAAEASVYDCIRVGRNTFQVTGGNLYAALGAFRSVRGCGDTTSGAICWSSRQWWGGWARWVVSGVTGGQYSRC